MVDYDIPDPLGGKTIVELLCNFSVWTFEIAAAAAVIAFLVAAYFYLTAGGSPARIESGKKALLYAVAGSAVVILAWGATLIIADAIGGTVTLSGCV